LKSTGSSGKGKGVRSERLQLDLQKQQIELEIRDRELRQARHALAVACDRYADLYHSAPVAYLTFDAGGCVRELNLAAAAILETQRARVIGQPFIKWLSTGEAEVFIAHLRTVAQVGRSTDVLRINGPGCPPRIVRLDSKEEPGAPRACRTAVKDITAAERRGREQEVELTQLARISTLGAMASTLAHEIIQPLTSILADTEAALYTLQHEPGNPALAIDAMEHAVAAVHRASKIAHSIKDFTRKGEPLPATIELNAIVHNAVSLLESTFRHRNVEVVLELAEDLPPVVGNGIQLEQVVVNLVMNAIDSIDVRGAARRITLRTSLEDTTVRLSVTDTGVGLPPEVLERMFKPFFSSKQKGHGIGLALSRTIIEGHGGEIWATPNDSGATVAFALPVQSKGVRIRR
jgi:C4-dicarboxylate-specific signal transduction histidine kinase